MRWVVMALFFACGCVATTSVTRTGTGLFAPRQDPEKEAREEDAVPRGLTLSIGAIAADGTLTLDLRNYSLETFTFAGSREKPQLLFEVQSGSTHSRHRVTQWTRTKTYELPAGERMQIKTNISGAEGRVRIGIRSQDFGYTVWTSWIGN